MDIKEDMSSSQLPDLSLNKALEFVKSYDCAKVINSELSRTSHELQRSYDPVSSIELEQLRNSLLLVTSLSSSQNLGICADNFQQGFAALTSYLEAFGYQHDDWASCFVGSVPQHQSSLDQENISQISPVYLKFSTQKMSYYSKQYTGEYRGVLVSIQSEDDLIAGTYGHFPWNLFLKS